MFEFQKVGSDTRPPVWRTVVVAALVVVCEFVCIVFSPWGQRAGGTSASDLDVAVTVLSCLAGLGMAVLLVWRARWPFTITVVAAVLAAVLPVGSVPALFMLASLLGRRRGPATWWCIGLVAVTTAADVYCDAVSQPVGASVAGTFFNGSSHPEAVNHISWMTMVLVWLFWMAVSIGAGMIHRSRRETVSARRERDDARATTRQLGDEVSRRQERERIAQEVHDSLGHRLSLVSLQAASLEAELGAEHAESAHQLRQSAGAAMDDLRSLLSVLSEPVAQVPDLPLWELSRVVAESFGAGQPISSSIYVSDGDRADPALSRAVYRTVQELLTNAAKHAPGCTASLKVHASPADGVLIECSNPLTDASPAPGTGRGLTGIAERAELLGGTIHHEAADGRFTVRVSIPWR